MIPQRNNGGIMQIHRAVILYLADTAPLLALATRKRHRYTLESLTRHVGHDLAIKALTARLVAGWLNTMDVCPSTKRVRLSDIRTFYRWAHNAGYMRVDPTIGVRIPRPARSEIREINRAKLVALGLVLPDARSRVVIALMLNEGLRIGEVARLEDGDIDRARKTIHIVGKGGHERILPITQDTLGWLTVYINERGRRGSGPLIAQKRDPHQPMKPGYLGKLVVDWLKAAGIKQAAHDGMSAHAFRHTRAGTLLDLGADPRIVQEVLGHQSLGTTWTYTRLRGRIKEIRRYMDQALPDEAA